MLAELATPREQGPALERRRSRRTDPEAEAIRPRGLVLAAEAPVDQATTRLFDSWRAVRQHPAADPRWSRWRCRRRAAVGTRRAQQRLVPRPGPRREIRRVVQHVGAGGAAAPARHDCHALPCRHCPGVGGVPVLRRRRERQPVVGRIAQRASTSTRRRAGTRHSRRRACAVPTGEASSDQPADRACRRRRAAAPRARTCAARGPPRRRPAPRPSLGRRDAARRVPREVAERSRAARRRERIRTTRLSRRPPNEPVPTPAVRAPSPPACRCAPNARALPSSRRPKRARTGEAEATRPPPRVAARSLAPSGSWRSTCAARGRERNDDGCLRCPRCPADRHRVAARRARGGRRGRARPVQDRHRIGARHLHPDRARHREVRRACRGHRARGAAVRRLGRERAAPALRARREVRAGPVGCLPGLPRPGRGRQHRGRRDHPAAARDHAALQRGDLFIARSDAPINFVHEIKDAKINVGPLRSGTAMSATTIYRQLFGAALPDANASFLSNEEAWSSWSATSRSMSWSPSRASLPSCWST